jgi:hypothetical protein
VSFSHFSFLKVVFLKDGYRKKPSDSWVLGVLPMHCKKKVNDFPVPGRFWSVTSQLGTGKSLTFFVQCVIKKRTVAAQMRTEGGGNCGVGELLCMCDSEARYLCVHYSINQQHLGTKTTFQRLLFDTLCL